MAALKPGDIIVLPLRGAVQNKPRPVVVLSSVRYQSEHPDLIASLLTANVAAATTDTDYVLQDWRVAGLDRPTAFRSYIGTQPQHEVVRYIGRLSDRDWNEVKQRVRRAMEVD